MKSQDTRDAEQLEEKFSHYEALAGEAKLFINRERRRWVTETEFSATNGSRIPGQIGRQEVLGGESMLAGKKDEKQPDSLKCWC